MDYNGIFSSLKSSASLFSLVYSSNLGDIEDVVEANHEFIMSRYNLMNKKVNLPSYLSSEDEGEANNNVAANSKKAAAINEKITLTEEEEYYIKFIQDVKPTQYLEVKNYFSYVEKGGNSILHLAEVNFEKLTLASKDYINMTDTNIQSLLKLQKERSLTSLEELQISKLYEFIKKCNSNNSCKLIRWGADVGFEYLHVVTLSDHLTPFPLLPLTNTSLWINDVIIDNAFNLFNLRQYLLKYRYHFNKIIYFVPAYIVYKFNYQTDNKMADKDISSFIYCKDSYKSFCFFDQCNKVFWPLNIKNTHWTLMEMDFINKKCTYYDSIISYEMKYAEFFFTLMKKFLLHHAEHYAIDYYYEVDWKFIIAKNVPQQGDSCNCGICVILNADYLSDGLELSYKCNKENFIYYRKRYALHILNGIFDYDLVQPFHTVKENFDTIYNYSALLALRRNKNLNSIHNPDSLKIFIDSNYNFENKYETYYEMLGYKKLKERGSIIILILILKFKYL